MDRTAANEELWPCFEEIKSGRVEKRRIVLKIQDNAADVLWHGEYADGWPKSVNIYVDDKGNPVLNVCFVVSGYRSLM
jgi:hypothetical protein